MLSSFKTSEKGNKISKYQFALEKQFVGPKNRASGQKLKFGFSEKATKFEKIFIVLLTRALCSVRATGYSSKSRRNFK